MLLLGSLTAFSALSIDLYLPGLPRIAEEFGASPDAAARTVSAFFLGMALGQLVYGPLSDRLGRRPPLLFGIGLYVVASLGCALAPSVSSLTLMRVLQALGGCAAIVVSRAIVGDLYERREAARIFSLLILVLGLAPILAPLLGTALLEFWSWRALFLVLAGFGLTVGVLVFFFIPESRSGETAAQAASERPLRAYLAAVRNPRLLGYVLTQAFNGACLYAYVANASDLLVGVFGVSDEDFALLFGLNGAGLVLGSQVNRRLLVTRSPDEVLRVSSPLIALFSLAMLLAALFEVGGLLGVSAPLFLILGTYGFVGANVSASALALDPSRGGTVSSLLGSSAALIGAGASALAGLFRDGSAVPLALTMCACSLAMVLSYFGLARPAGASISRSGP